MKNNKLSYRMCVTKTNRFITCQVIDDTTGVTLVAVTQQDTAFEKNKMKQAELAGKILADKLKDKKISNVYFDRHDNRYHGRVKKFADSLRENGLKF